jgi:DNA-binding XRE family transcriptional regulator
MTRHVLEADGKPAFVVLPYDEYQALLEQVEDLDDAAAIVRFAARHEEDAEATVPARVVDRLLAGEPAIRVWREYRGMTAAQLAAAVEVTPAHISKLETGKGEPSLRLLRRLARALDVEIDLLAPLRADD